jgi:hypothetical protein
MVTYFYAGAGASVTVKESPTNISLVSSEPAPLPSNKVKVIGTVVVDGPGTATLNIICKSEPKPPRAHDKYSRHNPARRIHRYSLGR